MASTETTRTIEQLAGESAMTVRTIRSYRTLGLIPPPDVRDGVGYYGDEHLDRLRLVRELQAEGFNLKGIKQLLDATHGSTVLAGMRRIATDPGTTETTAVVTLDELRARVAPAGISGAMLDAVMGAGILIPLGDDRYEAPSPRLVQLALENVRYGIPVEAAIASYSKVRELCVEIARLQVKVFYDHVWTPFAEAGYPADRWAQINAAVRELRPLAAERVLAVFGPAMADEIEATLGRELAKLSTDGADSAE